MKLNTALCFFAVAIQGAVLAGAYPYSPAALNDVRVAGGFWLPRFETNRIVTVKTDFLKCEETGRIANFEKAARREKGGFKGVPWDDSDVFKVIEGASYTLAQHPDAELDAYLDKLIAQIAGAQEADGYLYTARTIGHKAKMMGPKPFSRNRDACELYNVGHLYEAAVAHYEVTGKRTLLDVAIKNADLVAKTFGLGEGQCREVPGHEEIEIGLSRLYQTTGDAKYLKLAQHFIDMRGRRDLRPGWGAAYQDHVPVLEQKTEYPWKGLSRIEIADIANSQLTTHNFQLNIRVPGWCVGRPVPSDLYTQTVPGSLADFTVKVNGKDVLGGTRSRASVAKGYCIIDREWKAGDVVEVAMNMPVRRIRANDKVAVDQSRYAVERGPLVYCAEGVDNGGKVLHACLPLDAAFTEGEVEIASTKMVSLKGGGLTLIPYFAWCHRGAGEMQTWFADSEDKQ